jgi:glutaryl-CoA dehydrogenase
MPDGQTRHSGPSLGPFDWADPFHLGDQLGEDERMVAESARSFAGDRLAPRVTEAYLEEHVTPEIFAEMGEMGLLGTPSPRNTAGWVRVTWPTAWSPARWSGSTAGTGP